MWIDGGARKTIKHATSSIEHDDRKVPLGATQTLISMVAKNKNVEHFIDFVSVYECFCKS